MSQVLFLHNIGIDKTAILSETCRVRFEWDREKEAANVARHGVNFTEAKSAFADPFLVMTADKSHSAIEPRLFCIGRAANGGILTVRFTYRGNTIRIIGAGYWRKGRKIYEEKNR